MNKAFYLNIVDALVKDGYVVLNDALEPSLSSKLKTTALQSEFKAAGISGASNLHLDTSRRRDKIHWLDEDAGAQSEFLNFANELREVLNKELYLGLTYYESHFAQYDEGDFYEKHLDAFKNSKNRVVTTVYYLNEEWNDEDGGELVIYNEENETLAKLSPKANTLVVFMSEKFPHEVLPAKKKRFSIAGWYRIDKGHL
jgi:SM-20-related protein